MRCNIKMKKFMIVAVVVFAFALTMSVAFAGSTRCGGYRQPVCPCPDQSNVADDVYNTVSSAAYSGENNISQNNSGGSAAITAGSARSAAYGVNAINTNVKLGSSVGRQTNDAEDSANLVGSVADAGVNAISQSNSGAGATIYTNGTSSRAKGVNLVNTNVKVGGGCHRSSCN